MPRKAKATTGSVQFVNKPAEEVPAPPAPALPILPEPPKVDIPEQGSPTSAPAPPTAPKAKRAYKKKNGEYWEAMKGSRKELMKAVAKVEPVKETKNEVVVPPAPEKKKVGRPKKEKAPPAPKPPKQPKPVKEKPVKVPKPPPRKARVYEPSSEEEEEGEEEEEEQSESEEEPEVEIIAKKATKKLKTLDKIDRRIKALSNPYSAAGRFSVF